MKRIGDVLREYLKERGWPTEDPCAPLFRRWTEIAGAELGPRARLCEVEDGILVIEVDHPGWLQMLQLHRQRLLQAARRVAPQARIEGLRGRLTRSAVGPAPGGARPDPRETPRPEDPGVARQEGEEPCARPVDPGEPLT